MAVVIIKKDDFLLVSTWDKNSINKEESIGLLS